MRPDDVPRCGHQYGPTRDGSMVPQGTGKWSTITRAHKGLLAGKSRTGTGDDIRGSQGRPVRARENQGTSMAGHHDISGAPGKARTSRRPGQGPAQGWYGQGSVRVAVRRQGPGRGQAGVPPLGSFVQRSSSSGGVSGVTDIFPVRAGSICAVLGGTRDAIPEVSRSRPRRGLPFRSARVLIV